MSEHHTEPEVSVVVCIYNGEKTLPACIQSILEQAYARDVFEIIFVDDGSKDRSAEICREFLERHSGKSPKLTYVYQENAGLSSARNTGIYLARGQIIAFIDQDAVAEEHWLDNLVTAFGYDKGVGVVGGQVKVLNSQSKFASFIRKIHYTPGPGAIGIIGTNMAYRREVFGRVGGFFEAFWQRGDETSFILIKLLPRYKSRYVLDAIVYHKHPDRLGKWLRERFHNGKFYSWVAQLKSDKSGVPDLHKQLGKVVGWSAVPLFALSFAGFRFLSVVAFGSFSLLAGRYFRRHYHTGLKYLVQSRAARGWLMIPFAIVVQLLGMAAEDIGFFKELLMGERIDPSDSVNDASKRIVQICSNCQTW